MTKNIKKTITETYESTGNTYRIEQSKNNVLYVYENEKLVGITFINEIARMIQERDKEEN